ncbi:hypothetical protein CN553_12045 [Bacillus cereus]|uniref:Uncharacterized protein n=1 Tax=Bacillus cereus TaxID=1396 RepID=A0A9X6UC09_BACCE|nr:hypothetical protein [Bacillus cereus]PEN97775.1 hypothetical protein CN553_12045 [Bacillus cereus]
MFNSVEEVKKWIKENRDNYPKEVGNAIDFLIEKSEVVRSDEFVGMEIKDFYCNGFFGRTYDLEGAIVVSNGSDWVNVRTRYGNLHTAHFTNGWETEMRSYMEEWTKEREL